MSDLEYWADLVAEAAEGCNAPLTNEQKAYMADWIARGAASYSQVYYTPPASERTAVLEQERKDNLNKLERKREIYRRNVQYSIREALKLPSDVQVDITEEGKLELSV